MSNIIKSGEINEFQYEIYRDECPANPLKDMEFLGIIEQVKLKRSHRIGHEIHENLEGRLEGTNTIKSLEKDGWIIRKLQYQMDEQLRIVSDNDFVCYQYVTPEALAHEGCTKEDAIRIMDGELRIYNAYIINDVFGFDVKFDGELVDSCSGFYLDCEPDLEDLEKNHLWADLNGTIGGLIKGQVIDRETFRNNMVSWMGLNVELLTNRLFLAGECFIMDRIVDNEVKKTGFTYVDIKSMRSFSFSKYWETKEELENFLKSNQIYQKVY